MFVLKKISIITVFYKNNCEDYFLRYLNSINKLILNNLEDVEINVYILDNSPIARLKNYILSNGIKIGRNIKIIEKDLNGFAPANNYLAKISYKRDKCDYFFILNPDTEVSDLLFSDSKDLISNKDFFSVDFKQYPFEHPKAYDEKTLETSWCSGACELVDAKKFLDLEGFDERFFMYAEDVDLSWRAWENGYKCLYQPKALCIHHCYGLSKDPYFRQYWNVRNGILMRVKHGNFSDLNKYLIFLFRQILVSVKSFSFKETKNIIKAIISGLFFSFNYSFKERGITGRPEFANFFNNDYARIMKIKKNYEK